ncbi:KH domain-containing protein 5 [Elsinoe fawcettii]|nr:KH domain-containing protein 5 [Elsinoe fawcettii]
MSASPREGAAQSQKRPLEDPSSPATNTEQPDAKRPALDKVTETQPEENGNTEETLPVETVTAEEPVAPAAEYTNGGVATAPDVAVTDAPAGMPTAAQVLETQPAQATAANGAEAAALTSAHHQSDESQWLHLRSIISSQEAATVIGKGGENVSLIRKLSGAKCTVSEYSRGAVERILTVSGLVDAVAKAFGLIIRTLNNEPMERPSTPESKTYPLRLLIPHILIGSIIGKGGVRIREIQEASGARLNASDQCLPLSTERSLVVLGVADAIHIATFYVGSTLKEQLTERFNGVAASAYATRHGAPAGAVPGGMQVVPYVPHSVGGQWGQPDYFRRQQNQRGPPQAAYGAPQGYGQPGQVHAQTPVPYGAAQSPRQQYAAAGPTPGPYGGHAQQPHVGHAGPPQQAGALPGQPLTQQIFIPNDMVGAIIGKGGAKINEIRQLSGSVIKINEPQDNSNERLVTITGTQECNQMALYMLYSRLGQPTTQSKK